MNTVVFHFRLTCTITLSRPNPKMVPLS